MLGFVRQPGLRVEERAVAMSNITLSQSAIDRIFSEKKKFCSCRDIDADEYLIPVLQYYIRRFFTYKDGTRKEFGAGFVLSFIRKDKFAHNDYQYLNAGNRSRIAVGGMDHLVPFDPRIDWVNGKFCLV